ncbi:MAG TPA: Txe/YoeB family addiction module toxin [Ignavibacteriales bacterium]|nr:Txe/YoeB family addiction module toxin [Ignavibacteriales bacterium]
MVTWQVVFTKQALKDAKKIYSAELKNKAEYILRLLQKNPYQKPPSFEKLVGDLAGAFSRRINIQHRMVYQIYEKEKTVKVIRMWTHHE